MKKSYALLLFLTHCAASVAMRSNTPLEQHVSPNVVLQPTKSILTICDEVKQNMSEKLNAPDGFKYYNQCISQILNLYAKEIEQNTQDVADPFEINDLRYEREYHKDFQLLDDCIEGKKVSCNELEESAKNITVKIERQRAFIATVKQCCCVRVMILGVGILLGCWQN